jgi:flagellar M-ring protein FliF
MSELVPAGLSAPSARGMLAPVRAFTAQPAVAKTLPWVGGLAALGAAAMLYQAVIPASQRTLYDELSDGERSQVTAALEKGAIKYRIDPATGAITVNEDQLYKARMLVAADGAVAAPKTGPEMLDALPMGASRSLEGERLRSARERELELTIKEIDGVEGVRVHLAEAEKSVFVRDATPTTASIMVKLARGRQLGPGQVAAIVNLIAASVPGLSPDAVRVIDQHGGLLTGAGATGEDQRLDIQARLEQKLRTQLTQLLTPILGEGKFSSEIQVDLDMDAVTSARESYDKQGVIRSETQAQSTASAGVGGTAGGIPGVLANTPPPQTIVQSGPPKPAAPTVAAATPAVAAPAPQSGESSATRTYELGREVAVSNSNPGKIKRLSVAVAISSEAIKQGKTAEIEQVKSLVGAAVGIDTARGDQLAVAVRNFTAATVDVPAFYEAPWFAMVTRNVVMLIGLILFLFLCIRPVVASLTRRRDKSPDTNPAIGDADDPPALARLGMTSGGATDAALLSQQVGTAQRIAAEKPDVAAQALRQMIGATDATR